MKNYKISKNLLLKNQKFGLKLFYSSTTTENNSKINVNNFKAKDIVNLKLEEGKAYSFCRCWQSKKWPFCDGAHKTYNLENGESLGPVRIVLGDAETQTK